MTTQVILRIIDREHIDYLIEEEAGEVLASGSAFHDDQLPEFPTNAPTILIVPGESVLMLQAQLPKMSRGQMLKALPFALEEQLIDDPEALHFVADKQDSDGFIQVAVVKKALMSQWLQQCHDLQLFPKLILPDYFAVPHVEHEWHLYLDQDRALLRQSALKGLAIEQEQLATILNLELTETITNPPEKIDIDYDDGNEHFDLANLKTLDVPVDMAEADIFSMQLFSQGIAQNNGFNLLQGEFQANRPSSKSGKIWRWAIILLATWCVIWLASNLTQYFVYQHRLQAANSAISVLYKKAFPNAQSQIDPRLRIQRALDAQHSTGSGGPFLSLLTQIGQQLKQQKNALSIENFNYHNGRLILSIGASNFQDLASFTNALRQQGLNVQQQNAASQGNRVTARITVQGASNG